MKNKLIKLGAFLAFSTPIITVVSCGVNKPSETQLKALKNLGSNFIVNKVQEDWWNYVIKDEKIENFDKNDLLKANEIKENFDYLIQNEIYKDPSYLYNLSIQISENSKFLEILKNEGDKAPEVKLNEWGFYNKELSTKKSEDIEAVIDESTGLSLDAKKFIVVNLKEFRKKLYKFTIARRYLKKSLNKETYKKIFMDKNDVFTELQELFKPEEFVLLNETINQKLFINWNIELSEYDSVDYFGVKSNVEKNYDEVKDLISIKNDGTKGGLLTKQPLLNLDKKILLKKLLDQSEYNAYKIYGGYQGIKKQSKVGNGILDFGANKFKRVKNKKLWEGFIFDNKFINNKADNGERNEEKMTVIPENSKKVSVRFIKGLMPIFKDDKLTFENSDFSSQVKKDYLISALSLNDVVYQDALVYYTKRETNPILLKVKEPLKKILIDKGYKFIKE